LSEPQRSSPKVSRLNYRDESSGPIQSSSDTTFGKHWNNRKSRKQMRGIQKDLASRLKFQISRETKKRKHSGRKKIRNSRNRLQNFLMKGKVWRKVMKWNLPSIIFWIKIKMKREDFKISKYTKGKEAEG